MPALGTAIGVPFNNAGAFGVLRPPDPDSIIQWLTGTTDGLTIEDRISLPVGDGVIFNGTTTACDTGVALNYGNSDYEIAISGQFAASGYPVLLEGREGNDDGIRIQQIAGSIYCSHNAVDLVFDISPYQEDGLRHDIVFKNVGGTLTLSFDGDVKDTDTAVGSISVASATRLGWDYSGSNKYTGILSDISASGYFSYATDEGEGNTLIDSSGNGNDATITNGTWNIGYSRLTPVAIRDVNCLVFNGVDERAHLKQSASNKYSIALDVGDIVEFELAVLSNASGASGGFRGILSYYPTKADSINLQDTDTGKIIIRENGGAQRTSVGSYFKVADGRRKCTITILDSASASIAIDGVVREVLAVAMVGMEFNIVSDNVGGSSRELNASWSLLRHERDGVDMANFTFEEGELDALYSRAGSGIHMDIESSDSSAMWGTRDTGGSGNSSVGFSLYEESDVSIAKYYNNSVSAVMAMQDGLYKYIGHGVDEFWNNHMAMAAWLKTYNICVTSGLVVGENKDADSWDLMIAEMADKDGYHLIGNHSYSHPTVYEGTQEELIREYVLSKSIMMANLTFPDTHTYKAAPYQTSFMQFGGWGDFGYTKDDYLTYVYPTMSAAKYLALRSANARIARAPTSFEIVWNPEHGMLEPFWLTSNADRVLGGQYVNDFDYAYDNGGVYAIYYHPGSDTHYFDGSRSADWTAWAEYIGNKPEVWYTDQDSYFNYKYLRDVNQPDISYEMVGDDFVVTVVGDHATRTDYGLSTPLTYKINKPPAWGTDDVKVWYKDTGSYAEMTERSPTLITNGYFESDTGWDKSGLWTIANGEATMPSTSSFLPLESTSFSWVAGKTYHYSFEVVSVSGTAGLRNGFTTVMQFLYPGVYHGTYTAPVSGEFRFARQTSPAACVIKNVIVEEAEYFTADNCYRNEGPTAYVSQGLPQDSDSFSLKLVRVV